MTPHRVRRGAPVSDRLWAATAWERGLAQWLRTYVGLRLAGVVRRDAALSVAPAHIDLVMALDGVDLPIDVDSGWVPWVGRVVRFHYRGRAR